MLPSVSVDTLLYNLFTFLPESVLTAAIVVLLLLRLITALDHAHLGVLALLATIAAFAVGVVGWAAGAPGGDAFTGMLVCDNFTLFARLVLLAATGLTILLTLMTGIPDAEDSADFYVLLLGGTLGMLFMASANHLLMAYIAVEMASLPSYALAGFLKGKRM